MKSLIKIYRRYILTALLIIILLILCNIAVFLSMFFKYSKYYNGIIVIGNMNDIAESILWTDEGKNSSPYLSEEGIALMQLDKYIFAFILSPDGNMVWEWNVPDSLPVQYSSADIASMSKWYLQDYPVKVWRYEDYLLVCGQERNSAWKYNLQFPQAFMNGLVDYFGYGILLNLSVILGIILIAGYLFYRSLRPITKGIDDLAEGNTVSLPEKGIISEICRKLNKTSLTLEEQRDALNKRDNARTEWISGVSHDIRTPLSMIMGYADSLSADTSLSEEHRRQAEIIMHQSTTIKNLISDLNLTSKLEYNMQPLRLEPILLSAFLRSAAASFLNEGLEECYSITLAISEDMEKVTISGDQKLLMRVFHNLIGNSIQHNPNGCQIDLTATMLGSLACFISIRDDGCGIPKQIIQILEGKTQPHNSAPHIMGLRIAKQIILSHHGNFHFSQDGHAVIIELPVIA